MRTKQNHMTMQQIEEQQDKENQQQEAQQRKHEGYQMKNLGNYIQIYPIVQQQGEEVEVTDDEGLNEE